MTNDVDAKLEFLRIGLLSILDALETTLTVIADINSRLRKLEAINEGENIMARDRTIKVHMQKSFHSAICGKVDITTTHKADLVTCAKCLDILNPKPAASRQPHYRPNKVHIFDCRTGDMSFCKRKADNMVVLPKRSNCKNCLVAFKKARIASEKADADAPV